MTVPENIDFFNKFSVAVPSFIRHPTLRKLAERVQHETLNALTSPAMYESGNTSQSARILDSLYQTPIADASILVAITNERRPKLLLTRRAAHMNSHAGEVSCAGGKHEIGDGNNVVTALREACEETALPPNKVQLLGQLPIQTSKSGMSVRPIVALIAPGLVLVPEVGEISRIFWADLESLVNQPTVEYAVEYKMQEQTATILTPSWQVDGETVWGLTGRVIASLLETGFDRQLEWYYRVENKR
ncbi:MAG: CoA pyrophosphatase [Psychrobacter pacificensis]|uniref:NUDIX hydrolase n=1 Tax=Psychrobacter pacificensis TaxID=112002 RepID=UPI0023A24358|nr:CoA pyrophosphatase [Psychrobacter pacificensis]MDE0844274.1 CoA pyrophosphatase [Psychrobacter pacificensis]